LTDGGVSNTLSRKHLCLPYVYLFSEQLDSRKEGGAMGEHERDQGGISASAVLMAFLGGAAVGIVAALLLAPHPGEQSREQLRKYARRTGDNLRDLAEKAEETWESAVEKGRQFVHEQKSTLSEAIEAGREAMRRERDHKAGEKKS
jgi:gas vesicle protein